MSLPTHLVWKMEVHDADGRVIATATRRANSAVIANGQIHLLAESLQDAAATLRFLTPRSLPIPPPNSDPNLN